jgi:hypothetical protein
MSKNREEDLSVQQPESSPRRNFLKSALGIGGAAALLLSAGSRRLLGDSLSLAKEELDAARRAQQAPGDPAQEDREPRTNQNVAMGGCDGCTGNCMGHCQTSCMGGCSTSCKGGCSTSCMGGCKGSCMGTAR